MAEVVAGQRELFRQKFGWEMRDDDALFFDPASDTPRVMDLAAAGAVYRQMFDEMIERADEVGIAPALLKASRDLGYMVTTENQRLFPLRTSRHGRTPSSPIRIRTTSSTRTNPTWRTCSVC